MGLRIYQVDAFTAVPFAGNPAGVCFLPAPAEAGWMQAMAREMNVSETAFVVPEGGAFQLRWFTPQVEVELCGHATLASAHVLWEQGVLAEDATARFDTLSGRLEARRRDGWIEMDFPATRPEPVEAPPGLVEALGVTARAVLRSRFDFLVEVPGEADVRAAAPDLRRLRALDVRGVIVTARSDAPEYDFVSRFFAPGAGVDEDPATGSAHCALGPYWAKRVGKARLLGYQASQRGGVVRVEPRGDRVLLGGQAVTTLVGEVTEVARPTGSG
jgi:PhzF family phenazine biosynthesis protein